MTPSIASDGSRVGLRSGESAQIYVRDLDEFEARPIAGTQDASNSLPPCFSPDGTWIAYTVANSALKKSPIAGGAALTVAEGLDGADFCDWGEDGYIYFGTTPGIMRIAESGGPAEMLAAFDRESGESSYELPQLLPGGTQLLFSVLGGGGIASLDVAVLDLGTREKTIVLEGAGFTAFAPTGPGAARGHLVYGRNSAIFAAPFDLRNLEAGPASPVLEGVMGIGPVAFAGISDTGTLAYLAGGDVDLGATLQWVDRSGAVTALPEPAHAYADFELAPDGLRAAVSIFDLATFTGDLWLYELDGDRLTRLTFGGINLSPVWTPDGQRLIYFHATAASFQNGEVQFVPADNSAPPVTLSEVQGPPAFPASISPDGTVLIGELGANNSDIWTLPLDAAASTPSAAGGAMLEYLLDTEFNERDAVLSPDGRFLAYASNESGRDEVYVVPYPGPGGKTQVSTAGGRLPRWNRDGRELFYASGAQLMAVDIETAPVFRRLTPKVLFEAPALIDLNADIYDVAPDGTRFLMTALTDAGAGEELDLRIVVNWFEELRKLAPWPERDQ